MSRWSQAEDLRVTGVGLAGHTIMGPLNRVFATSKDCEHSVPGKSAFEWADERLTLAPGRGKYAYKRPEGEHYILEAGRCNDLECSHLKASNACGRPRCSTSAASPRQRHHSGAPVSCQSVHVSRARCSKQQLADEADAEAALISLVSSALTPIIREGDTSPGVAVRRIVASAI